MELTQQDMLEELRRERETWVPLTTGMEFFTSFQDPMMESLDPYFQDIFSTSLPVFGDFLETYPPIGERVESHHFFHEPYEEPQPLKVGEERERKGRVKKLVGQPSKNLMAERRRRKRLNDRLSMLRSIVPKISKMDRTSILGDTIDYMKELLERINKLKTGEMVKDVCKGSVLREMKQCDGVVRNTPKFEVERREVDTRVEIYCSPKPGLLLSTVNTLEALGLEIQQCVVSCFSDFSMAATCCDGGEQGVAFKTDEMKQALVRNAGYGGRCL